MGNKPLSIEVLINTLMRITTLLKNNNIEYFIMFGTLLGYIRDGSIIDQDDDVDIYVHTSQYNKIKNLKLDKGWSFGIVSQNKIIQIYFENKSFADIYFYDMMKDGEHIIEKWNYNGIKYKKNDIFPLKQAVLNGIDVYIPNKPVDITKYVYGERYTEKLRKDVDYSIIEREGILRVVYHDNKS